VNARPWTGRGLPARSASLAWVARRLGPAPASALCLGLWLGAGSPALAEPATYHLDPERSFVHFEVLHFGTSTIRGRIGPIEGAVTLDRAERRGEVALTIPTARVDTGLAVFDARLREDDLVASTAYPNAYFVARQFRFDGERLAEVRGEFTWRGVSQPLSLHARLFGCRLDTARRGEVCGGDFEAEIRRSEFGATFGLPLVGDKVTLRIQVEGARD
jgi:polyisoprenoid-binding protein YceI